MDHKEINRLTRILNERDQEIHRLRNLPKEKEVVIETHEVMDHKEIARLTRIINEKD